MSIYKFLESFPFPEITSFICRHRGMILINEDKNIVLRLKGQTRYGQGYGGTKGIPFYDRFKAGGPKSVRGYEKNSLSPYDKGLEIIEAMHLFDLTLGQIDAIIHPQSLIHSMVCYEDGSADEVMAQIKK